MPEFLRAYGEILKQDSPHIREVFVATLALAGVLLAFFGIGALVRGISRAFRTRLAPPPSSDRAGIRTQRRPR